MLAFSPQIILAKWPYFFKIQEKIGFYDVFNMEREISNTAKLLCFYAKEYEPDQSAIEYDLDIICKRKGCLDNLYCYPVPYFDHVITSILVKMKTQTEWGLESRLGQISLLAFHNKDHQLDQIFEEDGDVWNEISDISHNAIDEIQKKNAILAQKKQENQEQKEDLEDAKK